MQNLLLVAFGGMIGALSRYLLVLFVQNHVGVVFPWGTFLVNLSGAFLIGVLFELFAFIVVSPSFRLFLLVGCIGSYTTFSTFSLETVNLLRDGEIFFASLNILLNNIGCISLVIIGMFTTRYLIKLFL